MYNRVIVDGFIAFIESNNGIADKSVLAAIAQQTYHLTKDRSVYYCKDFAVRFCKSSSKNFANTVLSLSALQKYDDIPFLVCLVMPQMNFMFLANTTLLRKISHSSQELRMDNIKGSFNGSDIMRDFEGISNEPSNFEYLFTSHENFSFAENLERLVEATNNIIPTGKRFAPTIQQVQHIMESVDRAVSFLSSDGYDILNKDLQDRVNSVASEIAIAAFIDNVNLRGRIIEFLVTSAEDLRATLVDALHTGTPLPEIFTSDELGDYMREINHFSIATDIKTKVLFLSSNPKGYNIDKLLSFLSEDNSVYLVFVVAIDTAKRISTRLCSIYNNQLLSSTRIIKHWAGRNSRGVTQYDGSALERIVSDFDNRIDCNEARNFLERCLAE